MYRKSKIIGGSGVNILYIYVKYCQIKNVTQNGEIFQPDVIIIGADWQD
jgi:hypothetical protein